MQQRRDEILAKKAKLAELKRQRELRAREVSASRQSVGSGSDLASPIPGRADNRRELDSLISSLVGDSRPASTGPGGAGSPARGSRPNSVLSAGELSNEPSESSPSNAQVSQTQLLSISTPQALSTVPLSTVYEFTPSPVKEVFSYSKGVQTTEEWGTQTSRPRAFDDSDDEIDRPSGVQSPSKRLSRREKNREEELRENIRREIEEELKATRDLVDGPIRPDSQHSPTANFPARILTNEELIAVTSSEDFMDFVERSSKVIERALDQEYDVLADYGLSGANGVGDDDEYGNTGGKAYTKNPSAPHDPDGLVQVWNMHLHDRPEFVFHAQSDILAAKFSPFHPNLIIGGAYSGQVLLWDTRAKSAPVQKTPLTGSGHTHPVYSVDIVGTQNANNIISCSTDGVMCGWTVDMLAQPQELLTLTTPPPAKTEDMSPTCMAFPQTDPTYFLVGSEEGTVYSCHRYDRAGAKAGVDQRQRGPFDLGDLVLTSSLDWSVKLWKVRAPTATATTAITGEGQSVAPLFDFTREDLVYDAAWSPIKPGVFSLVDGAGNLEWPKRCRSIMSKSLNRVAWEKTDGKRIATGGIDGVLSVFEVGPDLGGKDSARTEEWANVKRLVARMESSAQNSNDVNGINGL
ncbi:hypothetical protein DID88_009580 [Monilinia fructigena]|uniref:Uncharacterized protein n=1 Tax=Monilinia fructigena TaxID=38457 RepID=A0A395IN29_9HELO|nr:hypothetical protein DID88_009580 [Monilinia fructigena]